jgi:hypothetical protein
VPSDINLASDREMVFHHGYMEVNTVMYFWVSQKTMGDFVAVGFAVAVRTPLSIMPNNRTSMDLCIHHIFSKELQKQVIYYKFKLLILK